MSKPLAITVSDYLKDPNNCPYCGSDNITADYFEPEFYRKVCCNDCNGKWTETFELTNITLEDEPSSTN